MGTDKTCAGASVSHPALPAPQRGAATSNSAGPGRLGWWRPTPGRPSRNPRPELKGPERAEQHKHECGRGHSMMTTWRIMWATRVGAAGAQSARRTG